MHLMDSNLFLFLCAERFALYLSKDLSSTELVQYLHINLLVSFHIFVVVVINLYLFSSAHFILEYNSILQFVSVF